MEIKGFLFIKRMGPLVKGAPRKSKRRRRLEN